MMTRSLPAFAFAALLGVSALTTTDANALPGAVTTCTTTADGFPVCVGIADGGGGYGASDFLGAFALSEGGWMEIYSDNEGVWWVEHNTNGSVTIGEEKTGGGAQKKKGPAVPNVPGTYAKSSRAVGSGVASPAVKPNIVALKAEAAKVTGTFATVALAPSRAVDMSSLTSRKIALQVTGTGSCAAIMIATKDGKFVSSTGIKKMSFPSEQMVEIPNDGGNYKFDIKGNSGCMASKASMALTLRPRIIIPTAGK